MKTLLTTILLLMLSLPAFADQQTTVLQEQATLGKASVTLPYIDGSNDAAYEKQLNSLIREAATKLSKEVGGGSVSYEVKLNRPSLVSLLLTASNGGKQAYAGLNLDLTTGKEFTVTDFFVDKEQVQQALSDYDKVLFAEDGFYLQQQKYGAYNSFVPYNKIAAESGLALGKVIHPTRLALTGRTVSPGMFDVMVLLGKERTIERLKKAIEFIKK